jgi:translation initiation factor IF-3
MQKKSRVSKKKQHQVSLKEMRYRPKIDEHDYQFKTRHVIDFLNSGHKVKLFVEFRGREMAHQEYGAKILDRLGQDLALIATVEVPAKMEGNTMTMVVTPKGRKSGQGIHDAQTEDESSSREEISENR